MLGFRFIPGILGLMNTGEAGSEVTVFDAAWPTDGGWIDSPFMLRGFLGAGEVIGRCKVLISGELSTGVGAGAGFNVVACELKEVAGKLFNGTNPTGESGEDEGEGSESGEESVVDRVVVGDESADSDICVDVLSLCLWLGSVETP